MLLFATTWMDLQDIILNEISERNSNTVMFSQFDMGNLNTKMNEQITQKHTHRHGE